jgi:hypothetical protein
MKWGELRGKGLRLVSIRGQLDGPGVQVQALDSPSGWATLSDKEGRFVLPDVLWYSGAKYELVISTDGHVGHVIEVSAPAAPPEGNVFDVTALDRQGKEVDIGKLAGMTAISYDRFDSANAQFYEELLNKLTSRESRDEDKIAAVNRYVATKLNYEETQWNLGSPRRVLERGSQYCGHLAASLATLLEAGGYITRRVDISDGTTPTPKPSTHMVVEVFYGGKWHLYDPTFGVEFEEGGLVASYRDVRLNPALIREDLFVAFKPNPPCQ